MTVGPVKIDKISEQLVSVANGQAKSALVMTFHVGDLGPFQDTFDREAFTAQAANAKIAAFAAQLGQLQSV